MHLGQTQAVIGRSIADRLTRYPLVDLKAYEFGV